MRCVAQSCLSVWQIARPVMPAARGLVHGDPRDGLAPVAASTLAGALLRAVEYAGDVGAEDVAVVDDAPRERLTSRRRGRGHGRESAQERRDLVRALASAVRPPFVS
jgi:hypothetical protein